MAAETYRTAKTADGNGRTLQNGYLFGVPVGDFGWFASLLIGLATGMAAFFFATFLGIVTILVANANGRHWDYAWSYVRVGLPVGLCVMAVALGLMGMLWVRRITRRA